MQIKFELKSNDNGCRTVFDLKNLNEINEYLTILYREQIDIVSQIKRVNPFSSNLEILNLFKLKVDDDEVEISKYKCKLCPKDFKPDRMRQHIGLHLILNDFNHDLNTCGFCGTNECSIEIKKSSGKGKNANKAPFSNCRYYVKFSLGAAATSTKHTPCTNRPIECPSCKLVVWSYNLKTHYESKHINLELPDAFLIKKTEIEAVKKYIN